MNFPYVVITDSNWRQYAAAAAPGYHDSDFPPQPILAPMLQGSRGYMGWNHPDRRREFRGSRPLTQLVPRSEWTARLQAGQGSFLSDLVKQRGIKALNQDGLSFCWAYGSTRAAQLWRILGGKPWLDLSPESVAGPCTKWRNQGGYASEAFDQMEHYGACQTSFMDRPWSLQPRKWKPGWQQDALQHELPDWYELDGSDESGIFDEVVSLLLNRVPVAAGLGWWGHLVCFIDAILLPPGTAKPNTPDGSVVGVLFQNSWDVDWPAAGANGLCCLVESRATPDGAAAPVVNQTPAWSQ